jgi:hypothetical protein
MSKTRITVEGKPQTERIRYVAKQLLREIVEKKMKEEA